ncbi:unnamed protein product [Phytophthora lilii]|uniref:Unnamed protein product n=1 Tax=Phytophthora lilii TaxID=2077276 RepID=A0A9W6TLY5_9STRA|nr:unnamed protein product [Phytophthora lilii]
MDSKPMPSSLAVLSLPKFKLLDTVRILDREVLASLSDADLVSTQAGLEELLRQAHNHVDHVMAQYDNDENNSAYSDGEDCVMMPAVGGERSATVSTAISRFLSNAVRTLRCNTQDDIAGGGVFSMLTAAEAGEARYRRLKAGFTRLKQHVKDVAEHRKQLHHGLDQLYVQTTRLEETYTTLGLPAATSSTNCGAAFTESYVAIEALKVRYFICHYISFIPTNKVTRRPYWSKTWRDKPPGSSLNLSCLK